jgi:hypothetical protein
MSRPLPAEAFVCGQFRDITEYKFVFSEFRPQSGPESRPWLESHLGAQSDTPHPSSEPVQSLFHWMELRNPPCSQTKLMDPEGDIPSERRFEEENASHYLYGFKRSISLDFNAVDGID